MHPHIVTQRPRLEAVYLESLRLMESSGSARNVIADTIGTKRIRAASKLLIPYRQLHLDPRAFGPSAASFDPDRFHIDQTAARSPSFRPFGGGVTLCRGRFLARQEVLAFVATVIGRFEVGVVRVVGIGKGGLPRPETRNPPMGMMMPVEGQDVMMKVREDGKKR